MYPFIPPLPAPTPINHPNGGTIPSIAAGSRVGPCCHPSPPPPRSHRMSKIGRPFTYNHGCTSVLHSHLVAAVEEADVHLEVQVHPLEAVEEVHERGRDVRLQQPQQAHKLHLEDHQL